ncbi:uncharacterized protein LOC143026650 [Oratosquilla oratoria]|uniref:uncharacterized protein LOC143026650 n=1 Tax=Oratosquilla oratoria TaxID=337810 RepID=UPI003F762D6D
MRCLAVVLLCCVVVLASADPLPQRGGGGRGGRGCTYWCRTPFGAVYCCKHPGQGNPFPNVNPGNCPPVRPQCPPTRSHQAPQTCAHDGDCGRWNKCCYDTCLGEHVCKPPIYHG